MVRCDPRMAKTWKTLLIYRIMDREMERCARSYFHGKLIDIGCGTKPYKSIAAPYITEHLGLDRQDPFNQLAEVDLVGTAYEIPAEDNSFDTALSTAALEHLSEPLAALIECHRILKVGGIAVYTVPFIWHLHAEPWDYFRFSKYGLKHLFEKARFEVVEIKALSGFWTTAATLFCYYLGRFENRWLWHLRLLPAVGITLQGLAFLMDKLDRAEEWTWMYTVVARKPQSNC